MKALRVLVVEDDAIIGMLLAELLEIMGHDVCAVEATEADAVTAASRYSPDLMIVDVELADGSGISAVDKILRSGPVSHMFVSGDSACLRVLSHGSVVLHKPYRESDLARAIKSALEAGVQPALRQ